ncbi:cytochrome-c peroxidase [Mucilaginibacter aquaedulcis]|uniref:cytochrome-c peroxidase n=1 Tax=Mucilaginibacter aquaedulcis TaxID=1187081 RepID=UPI0025B38AF9|nr:cytochrome c peroxidase [Mucilaginibacter aquaedulcis]MDN3549388.1 cytochrome c peroxidase [Mucilaginibacter aquaedulcis]
MNTGKKQNLFAKVWLKKSHTLLVLFIFMILLSGLSFTSNPVETGPYNLVYPANFGNRISIPADNPTTKQGVYLGRMLFYETRLSANNTLSCNSCHQQNKAFTDGLALSKGVDGVLTPRNSMSLANLLWARKFFWDGRANGLEEQAVTPLTNPHEMGQSLAISAQKLSKTATYPTLFKLVYGDEHITGDRIVKAISQFERTLISANSRYDQYQRGAYKPTDDELKGMELFNNGPQPEKGIRGANCGHCHGGPKTYMELFHNNGLDSLPKDSGIASFTHLQTDQGRFKVPTLRNIALTAPYMHDGRFKTLAEVVDHYSDHILESASLSTFLRGESNEVGGKSLKLLPIEKKQIIAFLNMLTDSTFINNPEFADPNSLTAKTKH